MRITLYEFNLLPHQEQYNIIFNEGIFLDNRIEGDLSYALYAIDRFYVEVTYNNKENKIKGKKAFITGEILDRYITNFNW